MNDNKQSYQMYLDLIMKMITTLENVCHHWKLSLDEVTAKYNEALDALRVLDHKADKAVFEMAKLRWESLKTFRDTVQKEYDLAFAQLVLYRGAVQNNPSAQDSSSLFSASAFSRAASKNSKSDGGGDFN